MKPILLFCAILLIFSLMNVYPETAPDFSLNDAVSEEELLILDDAVSELILENGTAGLTGWTVIRMLLVLAGVIAFIYAIYYFLKKLGGRNFQTNSFITVLSSQILNGNRALHLVEVGNQVFLVGAGDSSVNLVAEIQDKETLDEIRLNRSEYNSGSGSFSKTLAGFFRKDDQGDDRKGEFTDSLTRSTVFMQKQRERLKNM